MRFIIMAVIVLVSVLLVCAVFTQINIYEIAPDTILLSMLAMVLIENTLIPVLFTAGGALLMDMLFAKGLGFYTLPYVIVGLIVYLIFKSGRAEKKPLFRRLRRHWGCL